MQKINETVKFMLVKDAERKDITYESKNFACANKCGCQGCQNYQ